MPNWALLPGPWHESCAPWHCRVVVLQTGGEQQGCSPSRRDTAARGMQNKVKDNKGSRKHTVEQKVRRASGDSLAKPRLNRQTGVLILPAHKDVFVTALRKQIWLLPQENNNRTRADSRIHFAYALKMRCCNITRQGGGRRGQRWPVKSTGILSSCCQPLSEPKTASPPSQTFTPSPWVKSYPPARCGCPPPARCSCPPPARCLLGDSGEGGGAGSVHVLEHTCPSMVLDTQRLFLKS